LGELWKFAQGISLIPKREKFVMAEAANIPIESVGVSQAA
jgi:hypothetical protein